MREQLPLYAFFERLRQNDFPLGLDDYQRLLEALKVSMGLGVVEFNSLNEAFLRRYLPASEFETIMKPSLLRICKLLWLKPDQSTQLFEEIFNTTFNLDQEFFEATKNAPVPPSLANTNLHRETPGPSAPTIQSPQPLETPSLDSIVDLQTNVDSGQPVKVRIDLSTKSEKELSLDSKEVDVDKNRFLFTENYFPVDRRKVQQNLRTYPTFRNYLSSTEIDIQATVDLATKKAIFEKIVYKQLRVSTAQFLFVIDNSESMIAFRSLALLIRDEFYKAFNSRATPGEEVVTWYFNPGYSKSLYVDRAGTKAVELNTIVPRLNPKSATVVFFGDAGAAAFTNDRQLVSTANDIIRKLNLRTRKIVWINPFPKDRWQRTAAEKINETVAMFEANESGIKSAIDHLRGASIKLLKYASS